MESVLKDLNSNMSKTKNVFKAMDNVSISDKLSNYLSIKEEISSLEKVLDLLNKEIKAELLRSGFEEKSTGNLVLVDGNLRAELVNKFKVVPNEIQIGTELHRMGIKNDYMKLDIDKVKTERPDLYNNYSEKVKFQQALYVKKVDLSKEISE